MDNSKVIQEELTERSILNAVNGSLYNPFIEESSMSCVSSPHKKKKIIALKKRKTDESSENPRDTILRL
mgnify:CR=1 FL=1